MTPGDAAFMNPRSAPCAAIAASRLAMSASRSGPPFGATGPVQRGRANCGVPPSRAMRSM